MTALRFIILSISIAAHVSGKKLDCASGWVPYNGGWLDQEWRVDGGCFWGIPNAQACNASWLICAKANSTLATKRSRDGTEAPLTVREFLNFGRVQRLSGYSEAEAYVCVTKHAGYIPPEANIQRSKKACSTRDIDTKEKAIIITGGGDSPIRHKVEVLKKDGTPWCTLPDLPNERADHTQSGWTVCGGHVRDCKTWDLETRTWGSSVPLLKDRTAHSSWTTSRGIVLMGGQDSLSVMTSEIVTKSGSQDHFNMKYYTRLSCSIELPEKVIITGGFDGAKAVQRVSVYNHGGHLLDLPNLVDARMHHGCTSFIGNNDQRVFMVTGGVGEPSHLDTTEVLVEGGVSWSKVKTGALPAAMRALRVITVGNEIFSTGGFTFKPKLEHLKSILHFDKETRTWKEVGNMVHGRLFHAMGLVDYDENICQGK